MISLLDEKAFLALTVENPFSNPLHPTRGLLFPPSRTGGKKSPCRGRVEFLL